jgi:hypothetical protein
MYFPQSAPSFRGFEWFRSLFLSLLAGWDQVPKAG